MPTTDDYVLLRWEWANERKTLLLRRPLRDDDGAVAAAADGDVIASEVEVYVIVVVAVAYEVDVAAAE